MNNEELNTQRTYLYSNSLRLALIYGAMSYRIIKTGLEKAEDVVDGDTDLTGDGGWTHQKAEQVTEGSAPWTEKVTQEDDDD